MQIADRIQLRRDTASNWTSADPTLSQGEIGIETDTLKLKIGDGSTAWSSLGYYNTGTTANPTGFITVGQDNADYTSIQDAADSISGTSATNPYTIFIYPGVYSENVTISDDFVSVVADK